MTEILGSNWGKISAQPHPTLCIHFLDRENIDKDNKLPLGKQNCFTIVWGCAEILPKLKWFHPWNQVGLKPKLENLTWSDFDNNSYNRILWIHYIWRPSVFAVNLSLNPGYAHIYLCGHSTNKDLNTDFYSTRILHV